MCVALGVSILRREVNYHGALCISHYILFEYCEQTEEHVPEIDALSAAVLLGVLPQYGGPGFIIYIRNDHCNKLSINLFEAQSTVTASTKTLK